MHAMLRLELNHFYHPLHAKKKKSTHFWKQQRAGEIKRGSPLPSITREEKNEHMQELIGCSGIRSLASLGQWHWRLIREKR